MNIVHKIKKPVPRYVQIYQELKDAVESGKRLDNVIFSLTALAKTFNTSRTPVLQAVKLLENENYITKIGKKSDFILHKRNYQNLETSSTFNRASAITLKSIFVDTIDLEKKRSDWIFSNFENSIAQSLPFGQFWINEQKAADHYQVSRTVIRQVLSRVSERGLIRKDFRSHWVVAPLTSKNLNNIFTVRAQLEPLALIDAASSVKKKEIERLLSLCEKYCDSEKKLDANKLRQLEKDLHCNFLSHSSNKFLVRLLNQTQLTLVVNDIFALQVGTRSFKAAIAEHKIIYEFLLREAPFAAANALETHIKLSAERTQKRLRAISIFQKKDIPHYLEDYY